MLPIHPSIHPFLPTKRNLNHVGTHKPKDNIFSLIKRDKGNRTHSLLYSTHNLRLVRIIISVSRKTRRSVGPQISNLEVFKDRSMYRR